MRAITFTLLLAVAAIAAPSLTHAQEELPISKLMETIDVRVINIDVVVTDKKGNPVKGLKPQDFEVLENGVPQLISNFFEVAAPSGVPTVVAPGTEAKPEPAPAPEAQPVVKRRYILYVDNVSLAPFNRNRVFRSLKEFLKNSMQAGDEAMIATWNRSLKIRVPFTEDVVHLQQTLDIISKESAQGGTIYSERTQAEGRIRDAKSYDEGLAVAREFAAALENDTRASIRGIKSLMSMVAGVEGRKVMVVTSEGLQMQPGKELFVYLDEVSREHVAWGHMGSSYMEASHYSATNEIQSLAQAANANGITIYPLHAAGLGAYSVGSAENRQATSTAVQQTAVANSGDSMRLIADLTGGVATVGSGNFDRAFANINRDLSSYYSLGYRAGTERVDRQRNLQVRMRNKAYVARSRRSFVEKSTQTEMSDRVVANLFYSSSTNDLKIFLTTGSPISMEDGNFQVPVEIHLPFDLLTMIPQGDAMVGGFSVFVAAANIRGDMSDVGRQQQQLRFTMEEFEKMKGKTYRYVVPVVMEKGRNKISVGVVDDLSRSTGFIRQDVLAQDLR